jgi:GTP-binding protein
MALPRLAIVGRPNVGKSSLFNRLAGRRISIVDPTPGVTRDRISTIVELKAPPGRRDDEPRFVELVDTGGYGIYAAEDGRIDDAGQDLAALAPDIERQIRAAVAQADLVLFVIDAHDGIVPLDEMVARLLREAGLSGRVVAVANKVDDPSWEGDGIEAAALGFGEPLMVSAASGFGASRLQEAVWERVGAPGPDGPPQDPEIRFAIVGRRNAGKSSLVNALAGEPRVIVSEIAGTTRDAVDVRLEIDGKALVVIDTAGVRKRKSWADDVEFYSNARTDAAIDRADVCVLLLDATEKCSQVEKRLANQLETKWKPTVIAVNKWDLVASKLSPKDYIEYLTQEFPGLDFAPIVFVSARDSTGLRELLGLVANLARQARHREGTGRINHAVRSILEARGPSSRLGTKAKVFYVAQIDVQPPTLAMVVNKPDLFAGSYERYFRNQLREHLPFSEVPIRIVFSERKREKRARE